MTGSCCSATRGTGASWITGTGRNGAVEAAGGGKKCGSWLGTDDCVARVCVELEERTGGAARRGLNGMGCSRTCTGCEKRAEIAFVSPCERSIESASDAASFGW